MKYHKYPEEIREDAINYELKRAGAWPPGEDAFDPDPDGVVQTSPKSAGRREDREYSVCGN